MVEDDLRGAKEKGIAAEVKLILMVGKPATGDNFSIKLNGEKLDKWEFDSEEFLVYPVDPKIVKKGANEFEFLAQVADKKILIRDLQLWISYK